MIGSYIFSQSVPFELWEDTLDPTYSRGNAEAVHSFSGMIDSLTLDDSEHITVHYTKVPESYLEFDSEDKNGYWYVGNDWCASINGIRLHAPLNASDGEIILDSINELEERNTL